MSEHQTITELLLANMSLYAKTMTLAYNELVAAGMPEKDARDEARSTAFLAVTMQNHPVTPPKTPGNPFGPPSEA